MSKYLIVKARNLANGRTQKQQDLTGHRFTESERKPAQEVADQYATWLTKRTGDQWIGYLEAYTPSQRR